MNKWIKEFPEQIPHDFPPLTFLMSTLQLIMSENVFEFDNTQYHQKTGTAMGTPTACEWETLTYGYHERTVLLKNIQTF